jgi:hypothetical protein
MLLSWGYFLACNRTASPFPGACIGFCPLSSYRQASPVPETAVATDVHEALDVGVRFRAQGTFCLEFAFNQLPDIGNFLIIPVLDLLLMSIPSFSRMSRERELPIPKI